MSRAPTTHSNHPAQSNATDPRRTAHETRYTYHRIRTNLLSLLRAHTYTDAHIHRAAKAAKKKKEADEAQAKSELLAGPPPAELQAHASNVRLGAMAL